MKSDLQKAARECIANAQANLKAVDGTPLPDAQIMMMIAQSQCLAALTFAVMDVADVIRAGQPDPTA